MYELVLRSNSQKNIFSHQEIYWYPLKIASPNMLISINISTLRSYEWVKKYWYGGRIVSAYILDAYNVCFFYLGSRGDPLISKAFKEKPVVVKNECLNYIFSDNEMKEIYHEMKNSNKLEENSSNLSSEISLDFCSKVFQKTFEPMWNVEFSFIEDCDYCTELVSPNPILHFLQYTTSDVFSEKYYKKLFKFLLKKGFLASWLHVEDIGSTSTYQEIFDECRRLSDNQILSNRDIDNKIEIIVSEIFEKYEIFEAIYLASQCGSPDSEIHILFENLYNMLPKNRKINIEQSIFRFQPIFKIKSIEVHFIQATETRDQLKDLYFTLSTICPTVRYYDFSQHKVLFDEYSILKAIRKYEPNTRYRFICDIEIFPSIDYLQLQNKVYEIGNAIKTILNLNDDNKILNEMWVKNINMQIFTPIQFENDVIYALSQNWLIVRDSKKDYVDEKTKTKVIFVSLACDYAVFRNSKFIFSFNYITEIQYAYAVLNEKLVLKHNFTHFSVDFDEN